jgi:hypothetical protein
MPKLGNKTMRSLLVFTVALAAISLGCQKAPAPPPEAAPPTGTSPDSGVYEWGFVGKGQFQQECYNAGDVDSFDHVASDKAIAVDPGKCAGMPKW